MKKFVVLFVFALAATLGGRAQDYYDVVYLKNGSVVKGLVIELWPNDYLDIETTNGRVRTIEMDAVERIEKEGVRAAAAGAQRQNTPAQTQRSTNTNPINSSQYAQNNNRNTQSNTPQTQRSSTYSQNNNRNTQSSSQYAQNNNRYTTQQNNNRYAQNNSQYSQNNSRYPQNNQYASRNNANYGYYAPQNSMYFGVKAGLNLASMSDEDAKYKAGFHAGVFGEFLFDRFAIQPELLFSMQGAKASMNEYGVNVEGKLNLNYLNIPLMAKFYVAEGFSLEAGPQLGILLSAKAKAKASAGGISATGSEDVKDQMNSIDFSLNFGASYQPPGIPVGIFGRYSLGLTDIAANNDGDAVRHSVFQVGAFVKF